MAWFEPLPRGAGYRVVETGGPVIGAADRTDVEDEHWIDDQWSVTPTTSDLPIRLVAFMAVAVAGKVLLGRAEPIRSREPEEQDHDEFDDTLGPIGKSIVDGCFS